jgi:hypothetical protein
MEFKSIKKEDVCITYEKWSDRFCWSAEQDSNNGCIGCRYSILCSSGKYYTYFDYYVADMDFDDEQYNSTIDKCVEWINEKIKCLNDLYTFMYGKFGDE